MGLFDSIKSSFSSSKKPGSSKKTKAPKQKKKKSGGLFGSKDYISKLKIQPVAENSFFDALDKFSKSEDQPYVKPDPDHNWFYTIALTSDLIAGTPLESQLGIIKKCMDLSNLQGDTDGALYNASFDVDLYSKSKDQPKQLVFLPTVNTLKTLDDLVSGNQEIKFGLTILPSDINTSNLDDYIDQGQINAHIDNDDGTWMTFSLNDLENFIQEHVQQQEADYSDGELGDVTDQQPAEDTSSDKGNEPVETPDAPTAEAEDETPDAPAAPEDDNYGLGGDNLDDLPDLGDDDGGSSSSDDYDDLQDAPSVPSDDNDTDEPDLPDIGDDDENDDRLPDIGDDDSDDEDNADDLPDIDDDDDEDNADDLPDIDDDDDKDSADDLPDIDDDDDKDNDDDLPDLDDDDDTQNQSSAPTEPADSSDSSDDSLPDLSDGDDELPDLDDGSDGTAQTTQPQTTEPAASTQSASSTQPTQDDNLNLDDSLDQLPNLDEDEDDTNDQMPDLSQDTINNQQANITPDYNNIQSGTTVINPNPSYNNQSQSQMPVNQVSQTQSANDLLNKPQEIHDDNEVIDLSNPNAFDTTKIDEKREEEIYGKQNADALKAIKAQYEPRINQLIKSIKIPIFKIDPNREFDSEVVTRKQIYNDALRNDAQRVRDEIKAKIMDQIVDTFKDVVDPTRFPEAYPQINRELKRRFENERDLQAAIEEEVRKITKRYEDEKQNTIQQAIRNAKADFEKNRVPVRDAEISQVSTNIRHDAHETYLAGVDDVLSQQRQTLMPILDKKVSRIIESASPEIASANQSIHNSTKDYANKLMQAIEINKMLNNKLTPNQPQSNQTVSLQQYNQLMERLNAVTTANNQTSANKDQQIRNLMQQLNDAQQNVIDAKREAADANKRATTAQMEADKARQAAIQAQANAAQRNDLSGKHLTQEIQNLSKSSPLTPATPGSSLSNPSNTPNPDVMDEDELDPINN